jgi:hypothetical protein
LRVFIDHRVRFVGSASLFFKYGVIVKPAIGSRQLINPIACLFAAPTANATRGIKKHPIGVWIPFELTAGCCAGAFAHGRADARGT